MKMQENEKSKIFPFQCPILLILSQEVLPPRNLALFICLAILIPKDYPLAIRSVLHFPQMPPVLWLGLPT